MRRKVLILSGLIFLSSILGACTEAVEITDYAYVTMLGIEQGVNDKARYTFQIPKFDVGGGGDSGGGGGGDGAEQKGEKETLTVEAPSLLSAVEIVNSNIPLILNFMHLKAIVFSEEMAMSGNIGEIITPLLRFRQIRGKTSVIVCKDNAEEFIKATTPYLGSLVTDTLDDLLGKSSHTGLFPEFTFSDMYLGIRSYYRQLLGIYGAVNKGENLESEGPVYSGKFQIPGDYYAGDVPRKGGQEIELLGATVYTGDKMVGKLTGFETQMVLLVLNKLERGAFTIPDPEKPEYILPIEIKEFEKPKTTIDLSGEKPKIHTKIGLEGDITTIQSKINYETSEKKKVVEEAFEQFLVNGIQRTFAKCKILKSDVFEFGSVAVRQFWTIEEWENYNWLNKFSDSELTVEVDFTDRRSGKHLKTMPIISGEGKE